MTRVQTLVWAACLVFVIVSISSDICESLFIPQKKLSAEDFASRSGGKFVQRAFMYPSNFHSSKRTVGGLDGGGNGDMYDGAEMDDDEEERLAFHLDQLPSIREQLARIEVDLRQLATTEERALTTRQLLKILSRNPDAGRSSAV